MSMEDEKKGIELCWRARRGMTPKELADVLLEIADRGGEEAVRTVLTVMKVEMESHPVPRSQWMLEGKGNVDGR